MSPLFRAIVDKVALPEVNADGPYSFRYLR